jgi:Uma2 family endonuclease
MTQLLENTTTSGKLKFSFSDVEWLSEHGFFGDKHIELLNGEIFVKGQQGFRHAQAVRQITEQFILKLDAVYTSSQCPVVLLSPPPDFVEPDVALLRLPKDQYRQRDVDSRDVHFVLEISDSSLERDQTDKKAAYARNGIAEYWIYNLGQNRLEVYSNPQGQTYQDTQVYRVGELVAPLEFPACFIQWWVEE